MPGIADTDIAVASNALVLIGAQAIASFDDNDAGAVVAKSIYSEIVEDSLTSHPWRFASTQTNSLNRLSTAPDAIWSAQYQIPTNTLVVRRVLVNNSDINYEVYGDKIFCNAGTNDTVFANIIFRANEADWPPYFRLGVQMRLASVFAISVIQKPDIATSFATQADFQMRKARNVDSQIDTVPTIETKRFIRIRR